MDPIQKHYQALYNQHGNSPHAVQYSDKKSQFKRFEVLTQIDKNLGIVYDFGCGLADLYEYLVKYKDFTGEYIGLDFVSEFIHENKKKYGNNPKTLFSLFDIRKDVLQKQADYTLLSGVFNNKMPDNEEFMFTTLKKMFKYSSKGIAFNAMSTYVDYFDDNLYYSDPTKVFDFCKRELSRKVVLRNEYLIKEGSIPFEYCIYVYR